MRGPGELLAVLILIYLQQIEAVKNDYCGRDIKITDEEPMGTVSLKASYTELKDCSVRIDSRGDNKRIYIRLVGIYFTKCMAPKLSLIDNAADELMKYSIFNSEPHFCGNPMWVKEPHNIPQWSDGHPYDIELTETASVSKGDYEFILQYTSTGLDMNGDDVQWPEIPGMPSSFLTTTTPPPLPTSTTTSTTTVTMAPQNCPQNITREVDVAGDKARVVYDMPTSSGGYMPMSMSLPAGVHEYRFNLADGRECNLVIKITVKPTPPTTTTTSTTEVTITPVHVSCPQDKVYQVDDINDKIAVAFDMPSGNGVTTMNVKLSVGEHRYDYKLRDGTPCHFAISVNAKPTTALSTTTTTLPQIPCPQNVTKQVLDPDQRVEIRYNMYQSGKIVENTIRMKPGEAIYRVPISSSQWCSFHILVTVTSSTTVPTSSTTLPQLPCPQNITKFLSDPNDTVLVSYDSVVNGKIQNIVHRVSVGNHFYSFPNGPSTWCSLIVRVELLPTTTTTAATTTLTPESTTYPIMPCPPNMTREVDSTNEIAYFTFQSYKNGQILKNVINMTVGSEVYKVEIGPNQHCTVIFTVKLAFKTTDIPTTHFVTKTSTIQPTTVTSKPSAVKCQCTFGFTSLLQLFKNTAYIEEVIPTIYIRNSPSSGCSDIRGECRRYCQSQSVSKKLDITGAVSPINENTVLGDIVCKKAGHLFNTLFSTQLQLYSFASCDSGNVLEKVAVLDDHFCCSRSTFLSSDLKFKDCNPNRETTTSSTTQTPKTTTALQLRTEKCYCDLRLVHGNNQDMSIFDTMIPSKMLMAYTCADARDQCKQYCQKEATSRKWDHNSMIEVAEPAGFFAWSTRVVNKTIGNYVCEEHGKDVGDGESAKLDLIYSTEYCPPQTGSVFAEDVISKIHTNLCCDNLQQDINCAKSAVPKTPQVSDICTCILGTTKDDSSSIKRYLHTLSNHRNLTRSISLESYPTCENIKQVCAQYCKGWAITADTIIQAELIPDYFNRVLYGAASNATGARIGDYVCYEQNDFIPLGDNAQLDILYTTEKCSSKNYELSRTIQNSFCCERNIDTFYHQVQCGGITSRMDETTIRTTVSDLNSYNDECKCLLSVDGGYRKDWDLYKLLREHQVSEKVSYSYSSQQRLCSMSTSQCSSYCRNLAYDYLSYGVKSDITFKTYQEHPSYEYKKMLDEFICENNAGDANSLRAHVTYQVPQCSSQIRTVQILSEQICCTSVKNSKPIPVNCQSSSSSSLTINLSNIFG